MTTVNLAGTRPPTATSTSEHTRLPSRWVWPARITWVILSAVCLAAFVIAHVIAAGRPDLLATSSTGQTLPADLVWMIFIYPICVVLGYTAIGTLLAFRRSTDWLALLVSFTLIGMGTIAVVETDFYLVKIDPRLAVPVAVLSALILTGLVSMMLVFPDGRLVRRWHAWVFAGTPVLTFVLSYVGYVSSDAAIRLRPIANGIALLAWAYGFSIQISRYRRISTPLQRQQTKWILIGFAGLLLNTGLWMMVFYLQVFGPPSLVVTVIGLLAQILLILVLPIAFAMSLMRYRLWDVDFVINRSLVYGGLTLVLGLIFAGGFFGLRALLAAILGSDQDLVAAVIPAIAITALFRPARQRLQRFVDRQFYQINVDYRRRITPASLIATDFIPAELAAYGELTPIGKGGMAEVYLATHPTLNQPVAIKILPPARAQDPDYRQRFEREARLVAGLQHPNIVQLFDYGQADDTHFMVMEYIDGPTLTGTIRERAPMALDDTRPIIAGIAAALDYAHENGLVHRDVKPSNVMLDQGSPPRVVLMDFGIARVVGGRTRLTQTGNMVGTLDYIAPEQIQAAADVDGRADIYALGVIAYQMLTGQRPFHQQNPGALLIAHLQQPAPDPRILRPDLPHTASDAILRALEKAPGERFVTAGNFAAVLAGT